MTQRVLRGESETRIYGCAAAFDAQGDTLEG